LIPHRLLIVSESDFHPVVAESSLVAWTKFVFDI